MAYNPFDFFRRNQKILFAMITVMVMVMFVLSSGMGKADFFQWFPEWLGSKRAMGGETAATLEGKPLTAGQLALVDRQRTQVNEMMQSLVARAKDRLAKKLGDSVGKTDRESMQSPISNFMQIRQSGYVSQEIRFRAMMMAQQGQQLSQRDLQNAALNEMGNQEQILKRVSSDPTVKPEDLSLANVARNLLELDARSMNRQFFGNVENRTKGDQLEFELWKRKADKLGITITPAEAEKMAYAEIAGMVNEADFVEVLRELRQRDQTLSAEKFRTALADEFRVRLAQQAIMGQTIAREADLVGDNSVASPYQQFQFYQSQTKETKYGLIRLPVENYIDQVTGEPTAQEIQDLFSKYRTREPSPFDEKPGFKEPRKLKFEYLSAKGDEAFYKKAAADMQAMTELQARLTGLMVPPIGQQGATNALTGTGLLNLKTEDVLAAAYDQYKIMANSNINSAWALNFPGTRADFTDETLAQPKLLAALTATAAGSILGFGPDFTGPILMLERARIEERNAKARAQAGLFVVPLPGTVAPIGGAIALANQMPKPLPLAVLKPGTEKKLREQLAETILQNDLTKFNEELTKLGKGIDKASARNYLEKFIKDRGLKTGASTEFRDMFSIDQDPGLSVLLDRYKAFVKTQRGREWLAGVDFFGPAFFGRNDPKAGFLYTTLTFPKSSQGADEPQIILWRTDEQLAEEPKDANEPKTKAKILAAWKRQKARDIAKAKAEEIAKDIPAMGNNGTVISQKLVDLGAKLQVEKAGQVATNKARYFEIERVAPLRVEPGFNFDRRPTSTFLLQESADIPYATQEMQTSLLENREKAIGTAFVMNDLPKSSYYVAVLLNQDIRGTMDFTETVYKPSLLNIPGGRNDLSDQIRIGFVNESRQKAKQQAINLLKAEFKVENENEKMLAGKNEE